MIDKNKFTIAVRSSEFTRDRLLSDVISQIGSRDKVHLIYSSGYR